ncbi:HAD family hydrolase [Enterococcus sp. BWB1-3]|uniref:Cof-type HAD-IIB family hydrolase n=1 Tax=Enterococcus sp. BWB1-3 TaxID=2787713 RepID=UPI00192224F8|nr:Cof-type HAD-IIB family hydrolase [Enterococcus sp. BWB1-3]MBL1230234.1 HAD family hydrolase [Enterococcus sp. BWB1-3]
MSQIKMIAVDMDGTFLNSQNDYDRELFQQLYKKMQEKDVKFVVASGNQYYQLKSFFPKIAAEIAFVAENGAYIVNNEEEIFCGELLLEEVHEILDILGQYENVHTILCGRESAYVNKKEPQSFVDHGSIYYHRLKLVDDLYGVDQDTLFKFALTVPKGKAQEILDSLISAMDDRITPVSSGHEDIDLIIPGIHKANGLLKLQKLWGIKDEEVAAFGDSGNDLEMLKHAGFSYAMGNAHPKVKETAKEIIATNNENGVLKQIEKLLGE